MLKVLGISGSPRINGNSETLLNKTLDGANDSGAVIDKIFLRDYKISPCRECGGCNKTGKCVVNDDMQKLYPKLFNNNIIILASPIFFVGLSAQTKAFIDRFQCQWVAKFRLENVPWDQNSVRKGIFISVCGSNFSFMFKSAKYTVKAFFNTLDFKFEGELLLKNMDEKGDIAKNSEALQKAYDLGQSIIK